LGREEILSAHHIVDEFFKVMSVVIGEEIDTSNPSLTPVPVKMQSDLDILLVQLHKTNRFCRGVVHSLLIKSKNRDALVRLLDSAEVTNEIREELALETFGIFIDFESFDEAFLIWKRFDTYFR
jgi:uncharacterized protein YwbE